MVTITHNFTPAHLLLCPSSVEKPSTEQKARIDRTAQPEIRLWKLAAEANQLKLVWGELLVLFVFLAVVVSATVVSVQELSRLMRSNAIEHVAARALQVSNERER